MPVNQLKFLKKFLDKFTQKYSDLPIDIISDIIITVLIDAPDSYFSYNMIQEHPEFCKKCGACCSQATCPLGCFNGRTCDEYYSRPEICAEFPYYEINGEEGLMLDPGCQFAVKLAEMQIEKEIQRERNFLLGDIDESE